MSTLHIRLFAGFELRNADGTQVSITSARHQEMLGYILLGWQRSHRRSKLAALLWPETSDKQAFGNLRAQLSRLRARWSDIDAWLTIDDDALSWRMDSPFHLDVAQFEHELVLANLARQSGDTSTELAALHRATAHYQGPLLPSVFNDWVLAERERLEHCYLLAMERLIGLLEDQRQYADAISVAQKLLHHDPLHEQTYLNLMRLFALSGDRAQALRTYHLCATVLSNELGVEPQVELKAVYQRLLQNSSNGNNAQHAADFAKHEELIGRREEWQRMVSTWRRVLPGGAHFLLISGEAGIGKSRLAQHLREWSSRQGYVTAHSRAFAAAGNLAYTPIVEWLRSDELQPTLQYLSSGWLDELARLMPELRVEHNTPHESAPTITAQRRQLFESLVHACIVDAQPRLLVLDDLQWCDEETLAWLQFFVQAAPDARVMIVGTVRPGELGPGHPLHDLLINLRSEDKLTEIQLGPLNLIDSIALAEQVTGRSLDPSLHEKFFADTSGNPLFVIETAKIGFDQAHAEAGESNDHLPIPPKVYDVIRTRLARLSPDGRAVVAVASTMGRSFSFPLLAAVCSLSEERLISALDDLWRTGIILQNGADNYDFSHDRIRDVAYSEIGPIRRPYLHIVIARSLEERHADNLDTVAAQLAYHWSAANQSEQAIAYYRHAAHVAMRRLALSEAVALFSACLARLDELPDTPDVQRDRLAVLIDMYQPFTATKGWWSASFLPLYMNAYSLAQAVGTFTQQMQITGFFRSYYHMQGQHWQALEYAKQYVKVAAEPQNASRDQNLVDARGSVGMIHLKLGNLKAAETNYGSHEYSLMYTGLGAWKALLLWLRGYPDQAKQQLNHFQRGMEGIKLNTRAVVLQLSAVLHYARRETNTHSSYIDKLRAEAYQHDLAFWQVSGDFFCNWCDVRAGEVQPGLRQMESAVDAMRKTGCGLLTMYLCILAETYLQVGNCTAADAALKRALAHAESGGEFIWYAELQRQMGNLLLAQNKPTQEVEHWYQAAIKTAQEQGARIFELRAVVSLCQLWRHAGQNEAARDLLDPLYATFTEGFDTTDLIEARELLIALS